jgi:hypothetical protein
MSAHLLVVKVHSKIFDMCMSYFYMLISNENGRTKNEREEKERKKCRYRKKGHNSEILLVTNYQINWITTGIGEIEKIYVGKMIERRGYDSEEYVLEWIGQQFL